MFLFIGLTVKRMSYTLTSSERVVFKNFMEESSTLYAPTFAKRYPAVLFDFQICVITRNYKMYSK